MKDDGDMLKLKLSVLVLFVAAAAFVSGCGESPPETFPVEGTITVDGQPLNMIRVEFIHETEGAQFAASTDDQGRFVLVSSDGTSPGVIAGKYKVVLRDETVMQVKFSGRDNEEVDVSQGAEPRIDDVYTNVMRTPLQIEITREDKNVAFDVKPHAK
ncbi:MAG: carboxypeptidase regulatory-like domain-containing protein [Planctomycetaceae bacterium]|nr:carboxypeptidase regulatory-like domain-containing protein [Planctomycetaceae bacterium]